MRRVEKGILFWGMAILVGLLVISSPLGAKEKVITIGDYSTLRTLDPPFTGMAQDIMMCRGIYQGLLRYKFNTSEI